MTVHFIGAGPGAADLITVRGRDSGALPGLPLCRLDRAAGAAAHCPPGARMVDTAPMSLDEIEAEFVAAHRAGQDVARLHSGDLSVWSAVAEQIRRLERQGIPYTLTPGVPAFAAAAAALGRELTIPEVAQSLVLTRVSGRASAMPAGETLAAFGATGATLAIHLAIHALAEVVAELTPLYGADCPVGGGGPRQLARRADRARNAGDIEAQVAGRADRAHGADPRRPGAGARGFPRERALRCRLSAALQGARRDRRPERALADQLALAVEDQDLERDVGCRRARRPRCARRAAARRRRAGCLRRRRAEGIAPPCWRRGSPRERRRSPPASRDVPPAPPDRPRRAWNGRPACLAPAWSSWRRRRRR